MRTGANSNALAEFQTYLRLEPNGEYAAPAREISGRMLQDGITPARSSASNNPAAKP